MDRQIGDRAVVLGASMAGLLAARVLADGYGQVTVIDRDELPEASDAPARRPPRPPPPCAGWPAGSRPWRSCSLGSPPSWSPTGCRPATCWPTRACTSAATGSGRRRPDWCCCAPAGRSSRAACVPGCGRSPTCASSTAATSSGWPRRPIVAASPGRACSAGPTAAPRRCSAPTWWSTPPAVAPAPRRGWRRSATRGRQRSRCGSGWAMPPGSTGCPPTPSAATWRSCTRPPPGIHGPGRSRCSRATGGW